MEFVIIYIIYGVIFAFGCSYLAKEKGKDTTNWALLGFLFGIIALLIIGLTPKSDHEEDQSGNITIDNATKKCSYCAEIIKLEAIKCKYCGETFDRNDVSKEIEEFENCIVSRNRTENDIRIENDRVAKGLCLTCGKQLGSKERYFNWYCKECKVNRKTGNFNKDNKMVNNKPRYIEYARGLINDKRYDDAIKILSKAINDNVETATAYYMRAVSYSKISETEKAINDLKKSANLGNLQAINYLQKARKGGKMSSTKP